MKTALLIICCLPFLLNAQIYPFSEGFSGTTLQPLPVDWSGDMKVRASHGLDYGRGLAADISSADDVDSAITPWIGPLDNNVVLYFWYRMVDDDIYPSTEKHLTTDKFTISISTDEISYVDLLTIDSSNHKSSVNFRKDTVY